MASIDGALAVDTFYTIAPLTATDSQTQVYR